MVTIAPLHGGGNVTQGLARPPENRKPLHEICPHLAKRIPGPYEHPYVTTVPARPQTRSPRPRLTSVTNGNIPLILSVPHGASNKDPSYSWQAKYLPLRAGASAAFNASDFQSRLSRVSTDMNTILFAEELARLLKREYRVQPYVVTAHFHRSFVDPNRRVNGSLDCCPELWPKCQAIADYQFLPNGMPDLEYAAKVNLAREVYDEYHRAIFDSISAAATNHPGRPIFFVDLHAQKAVTDEQVGVTAEDMRDTIIVGTQNGRLVRDRADLYASGGLLDLVVSSSGGAVKVFPPGPHVADHPKYNGGHIVAEFSFNNTVGAEVNAVQFELGYNLRLKASARSRAVAAVAHALASTLNPR